MRSRWAQSCAGVAHARGRSVDQKAGSESFDLRVRLARSGGSYATFFVSASVVVLGSALGLLLPIQGLAWVFGYRKSVTTRRNGLRGIFHLIQ